MLALSFSQSETEIAQVLAAHLDLRTLWCMLYGQRFQSLTGRFGPLTLLIQGVI
jgi:hypothetical protein